MSYEVRPTPNNRGVYPYSLYKDNRWLASSGDKEFLELMAKRLEYNIETVHDRPPVPFRDHDWTAFCKEYDLDDPVAHGATEEEAVRNLIEMLED